MFENKKVAATGIHYSRYIASWRRMGGGEFFDPRGLFRDWLISEGCTDEEVFAICEMANCGKMELERSAICFMIKKQKEQTSTIVA